MGGLAVGHTAVGGLAIGKYALGGLARGTHVISQEDRLWDPGAMEYFQGLRGSWRMLGQDKLLDPLWEELDRRQAAGDNPPR